MAMSIMLTEKDISNLGVTATIAAMMILAMIAVTIAVTSLIVIGVFIAVIDMIGAMGGWISRRARL